MSFGRWLQQQRTSQGLSGAELAQRLQISAALVQQLEADVSRPSLALLQELFTLFDVPLEAQTELVYQARALAKLPTGPALALDSRTRATIFPQLLTSFVGREREVEHVAELLLRPDVRLVTLTGPPGVGKTRLSLQVLHEVQARSAQEWVFVPLDALSSDQLVLETIGYALQVPFPAPDPLQAVLDGLAQRDALLLVLDNFEHVMAAAPQIAELLYRVPHLTCLTTSREPLRLSLEHEYSVPPLPVPSDLSADLSANPAVSLFVQRLEPLLGSPHAKIDLAMIAKICQQLEGLPLALELAAASAAHTTLPQIYSQLQYTLKGLRQTLLGPQQRQQSMESALEWSFRLLNPEQQTVFLSASVFAGGCTPESLAIILAEQMVSPLAVLPTLQSLVEKNLMQWSPSEDIHGRFAMLTPLRQYAQSMLIQSDHLLELKLRYADYFVRLALQGMQELTGPAQMDWKQRLEREYANLRTVLTFLIEQEHFTSAAELAVALSRFWYIQGYHHEGRAFMEQILDGQTRIEPGLLMRLYKEAGVMLYALGQLERARSKYERALQLAWQLEDERFIASVRYNLSLLGLQQGSYDEVESLLRENLAFWRNLDEPYQIANTLNTLGIVATRQNHLDEAVAFYQESLKYWRLIQHTVGLASTYNNLGELALYQNQLTSAEQWLRLSLDMWRSLDSHMFIANTLHNLGQVHVKRGQLAQAAVWMHEALVTALRVNDWACIAEALTTLADLLLRHNDLGEAAVVAGVADQIVSLHGIQMPTPYREARMGLLQALREQLDPLFLFDHWQFGAATDVLTYLQDMLAQLSTLIAGPPQT